MKKLLVLVGLTIAITACQSAGSQQKKGDNTVSTAEKITSVTPDELFGTPEKYAGQVVTVKGLCVHTCKHSGKRLFLQGTDEEQLLLVTASDDIAKFENSLEGSDVVVTGKFSVIEQAAEDHEHNSDKEACETESRSKNYQVECLSFAKAE